MTRCLERIISALKREDTVSHPEGVDPRWGTLQEKLREARSVVDLGCGNNPVSGAQAAVDRYLDPKERIFGTGPAIDVERLKARGVEFFNSRIDAPLPFFKDKQFDFAYSHHAFEHLEDPATACQEMMRIARSGAIVTPSLFADLMFGRPYHRWLVMDRGNTLLFFRKQPFENMPFGIGPKLSKDGKTWMMDKETNPFDMLLNDCGWYRGEEGYMPKLSKMLRQHWFTHSPLMEVVFLWDDEFQWKIFE